MRRNRWATLALLAAVGCQSSGSTSSWRWPWSKAPAREPFAQGSRSLDDSADAIYGGRDPLLSGSAPPAAGRNRTGLDEPLRMSEPPAAPAAASSKKPYLVLGKPKWLPQ